MTVRQFTIFLHETGNITKLEFGDQSEKKPISEGAITGDAAVKGLTKLFGKKK